MKKLLLSLLLLLLLLSTFGAQAQITNSLISHWTFDSDYSDTFGTNHLSASGGVSLVPGVIGNAAQFDGVDGVLSVASNASLQTGATDWSIFLFVRDDFPGGIDRWLPVISKADDGGWIQSEYDFSLYQTNPQQTPAEFLLASIYYYNPVWDYVNQYAAVDSIATVDASPTWRAVLITHDYTSGTFSIRVDDNAPVITPVGVDSDFPQVSDAPLRIGGGHIDGFGDYFGAISVDDVWFWKRKVTKKEFDLLRGKFVKEQRRKRG